jgi:hypothetical protein
MVSKDNNQIYKLVLYNKEIKKATAKINRLNPELNNLTVKGHSDYKSDLIETIYKRKCEPSFKQNLDCLEIKMIDHVVSTHKYYKSIDNNINPQSLLSEYYNQTRKNQHNVYQYNLL